jgi:hypothetical protein
MTISQLSIPELFDTKFVADYTRARRIGGANELVIPSHSATDPVRQAK